MGRAPYGSPRVHLDIGDPKTDIFQYYKQGLITTMAEDRAVRKEKRQAKREHRPFDPDNITDLVEKHLKRGPFKSSGMRYHSFVTYFNIKRLGWVEATDQKEPSAFQDHYPKGQPRIFYRLTKAGREASKTAWANPQKALYVPRKQHSGK